MNKPTPHFFGFAVLALSLGLLPPCLAQTATDTERGAAAMLKIRPAVRSCCATTTTMLAATTAGQRFVAVGDYGTVLLSDDKGRTFRQAKTVPVSSTLTSVAFADDKNGWAVGHWGVILNTADGGETWTLQRSDTQVDRPFFSLHFFDNAHGVAVGLWSLVLVTDDGGKHWTSITLPEPPDGGKGDRNLFKAFGDAHQTLYVAAERGAILKSVDQGKTWRYQLSGYKGSFWSGLALKDGALLVAGLRGTIYRSDDGGATWRRIEIDSKSSITDLVEVDGAILGVGLDGVSIRSNDGGRSFVVSQREDRLSLTAIGALNDGTAVLFSKNGVVVAAPKSAAK